MQQSFGIVIALRLGRICTLVRRIAASIAEVRSKIPQIDFHLEHG